MDTKQLEKDLEMFFSKCIEKGFKLENHCLIQYDSSFILEVKANWIDELDSCSKALDILNDILWQTTSSEIRKNIFAISVLDSEEHLHCYSELPQEN